MIMYEQNVIFSSWPDILLLLDTITDAIQGTQRQTEVDPFLAMV